MFTWQIFLSIFFNSISHKGFSLIFNYCVNSCIMWYSIEEHPELFFLCLWRRPYSRGHLSFETSTFLPMEDDCFHFFSWPSGLQFAFPLNHPPKLNMFFSSSPCSPFHILAPHPGITFLLLSTGIEIFFYGCFGLLTFLSSVICILAILYFLY